VEVSPPAAEIFANAHRAVAALGGGLSAASHQQALVTRRPAGWGSSTTDFGCSAGLPTSSARSTMPVVA
jgi:hypothetical protein